MLRKSDLQPSRGFPRCSWQIEKRPARACDTAPRSVPCDYERSPWCGRAPPSYSDRPSSRVFLPPEDRTMPRLQQAIGITVLSVLTVLGPIRAAAQDSVPPLVQISGDLA